MINEAATSKYHRLTICVVCTDIQDTLTGLHVEMTYTLYSNMIG